MKIRMGSIIGSSFIKAVGFSGVAGDTATLRIHCPVVRRKAKTATRSARSSANVHTCQVCMRLRFRLSGNNRACSAIISKNRKFIAM